jgi:hypothetical protein
MNPMEAALHLASFGISVVPSGMNKSPTVAWTEFQTRVASNDEIKEWFESRYRSANVSIITGKVSGITVVDIDSFAGFERISEFLPDSLITPMTATPAIGKEMGLHIYFDYIPGIPSRPDYFGNKCGIDIRNDGATVLAPPSKMRNGTGYKSYVWKSGLELTKTQIAAMPEMLKDVFLQFANFTSNGGSPKGEHVVKGTNNIYLPRTRDLKQEDERNISVTENVTKTEKPSHSVTKVCEVSFCEPGRDNTLFYVANHLVRGGMPIEDIEKVMEQLGSTCCPPFPQNELRSKVKSAIDRGLRKEVNITKALREWIDQAWGNFTVTEALQSVTNYITPEMRSKVRVALSRFVNEGYLERVENKNGVFKKVNRNIEFIDIKSAIEPPFEIEYPLDLHELFVTYEKNIIVFAGSPNVGKTAVLMNCARMNVNRGYNIRYQTSEMGKTELQCRINLFKEHSDIPTRVWDDIQFIEESENFAAKIDPDGLNIIDYLELYTDFFLVNKFMTDIYKALRKGIAIIGLQKDPKKEYARGGMFGIEKPRLVVNMDFNPPEYDLAKIVKLKNRRDPAKNFNGSMLNFTVKRGCIVRAFGNWTPQKDRE